MIDFVLWFSIDDWIVHLIVVVRSYFDAGNCHSVDVEKMIGNDYETIVDRCRLNVGNYHSKVIVVGCWMNLDYYARKTKNWLFVWVLFEVNLTKALVKRGKFFRMLFTAPCCCLGGPRRLKTKVDFEWKLKTRTNFIGWPTNSGKSVVDKRLFFMMNFDKSSKRVNKLWSWLFSTAVRMCLI